MYREIAYQVAEAYRSTDNLDECKAYYSAKYTDKWDYDLAWYAIDNWRVLSLKLTTM